MPFFGLELGISLLAGPTAPEDHGSPIRYFVIAHLGQRSELVKSASKTLTRDCIEKGGLPDELTLPPGREEGVPLPVRTDGGGGIDGDESVHGSPHGFE